MIKSDLDISLYILIIGSSFISSFGKSKDLFLFTFFLDVLLQLTTDGLLELARTSSTAWQVLISLRLDEHSLEGLNSLSHASVERSLDGVEVIVQVLAEANQEGEWLIQSVLQVPGEEGERDHAV